MIKGCSTPSVTGSILHKAIMFVARALGLPKEGQGFETPRGRVSKLKRQTSSTWTDPYLDQLGVGLNHTTFLPLGFTL